MSPLAAHLFPKSLGLGDVKRVVSKELAALSNVMRDKVGRMLSTFTENIFSHLPKRVPPACQGPVKCPRRFSPEGGKGRPVPDGKGGKEKGKGGDPVGKTTAIKTTPLKGKSASLPAATKAPAKAKAAAVPVKNSSPPAA